MKSMVLMLLAMVVLTGCAGVQTVNTEDMQMQRIIDVPNTSKSILYDRSRMWYAAAFNSAKSVIEYEDKNNGTIMGNGYVSIIADLVAERQLAISISTELKDNKARITLQGKHLYNPQWGNLGVQQRYWESFKLKLDALMSDYTNYISVTKQVKSDNW